ncbi:MAG: VCBS repeat-containing protein [bacterium]|nr:VCBS repeat-containing protein [bacterium]
MKKWFIWPSLLVSLLLAPYVAQCQVEDGFKVWITEWDSGSLSTGYPIVEWTYDADAGFWDAELPLLDLPLIQNDQDYEGPIFDMGMDMIELNGTLLAVLAVSKGDSHFPSKGTEFQIRKINQDGFWAPIQNPIHTTPAAVSPLGIDIFKAGNSLYLAWVEDNDADGPKSNKGEIYQMRLTQNADGTLAAVESPVLIYSHTLNWGGTHPGNGGINGIAACDWDGDGDTDYAISQMYYGDSPASSGIFILLQTAPGVWATSLKEVHWTSPGSGSEALTCCDIDGDNQLDFLKTNEAEGNWSQVYWYEKNGDVLEPRDLIIDCGYEAQAYDFSVGHIFGLYAGEPVSTGTSVQNWELQ